MTAANGKSPQMLVRSDRILASSLASVSDICFLGRWTFQRIITQLCAHRRWFTICSAQKPSVHHIANRPSWLWCWCNQTNNSHQPYIRKHHFGVHLLVPSFSVSSVYLYENRTHWPPGLAVKNTDNLTCQELPSYAIWLGLPQDGHLAVPHHGKKLEDDLQ